MDWPQVQKVLDEKRYELVLQNIDGPKKTPPIDDHYFQSSIFSEGCVLNLLEIHHCGLSTLSPTIVRATHLTNLVLRGNSLKSLPEELGALRELRLLDVSNNALETLPSSLGRLTNLHTLNASSNKLSYAGLPDFSSLVALHILDLSHNEIDSFRETICSSSLVKLLTLSLSNNAIASIPDSISELPTLRDLHIASNQLKELPYALTDLVKLKTLDLKNNPFADSRFRKLTNDPRHKVSAILEYLRKRRPERKERSVNGDGRSANDKEEAGEQHVDVITDAPNLTVKRMSVVTEVRPHLICWVLKNLDLHGENFRKFINIQTKLHSGICDNRAVATIGTHDLKSLTFPLTYLALEPDQIYITALHKKTPVSGSDLIASLLAEAELARKRQKRSTLSNIHKYLYMVKDLPRYACLTDASGLVLSLAPLTNSDVTKLSEETREVFVEVSGHALPDVRRVACELLNELVAVQPSLVVEQVRVRDEQGHLLSVFPDFTDVFSFALQRLSVAESHA